MLKNIFLIAGLYILFGGLVSWYRTRNFLARCVKTKGVVVSHHYLTNSDEGKKTTTSFPLYRFNHPITGTEYTVRSNVSGRLEEGQEIRILFDPQDPENAKIDNLYHTWMIPIVVTFLGVIFSFLGVLARNTMTTTFSIFDKIILVFLAIIFILSLRKFVKLKLDVPSKHRKL
jgi:hypothetical protein